MLDEASRNHRRVQGQARRWRRGAVGAPRSVPARALAVASAERRYPISVTGCPPVKIDNLDGVLTCNVPPMPPTISVTRIESVTTPHEVTGSGFQGGSTVRIRVVSTPPNEIDFNNSAKVDGTLDAKVNPGRTTNIVLHFNATDRRPNTHDLTRAVVQFI